MVHVVARLASIVVAILHEYILYGRCKYTQQKYLCYMKCIIRILVSFLYMKFQKIRFNLTCFMLL